MYFENLPRKLKLEIKNELSFDLNRTGIMGILREDIHTFMKSC